MTENRLPSPTEIESICSHFFVSSIESRTESLRELISLVKNEIKSLQKKLNDAGEDNVKIRSAAFDYHTSIARLIKEYHIKPRSASFNEEFPDFDRQVENLAYEFEETRKLVQHEDRFVISSSDGFVLKLMKRFKRLFFSVSQLPVKSGNFFRKIFKRPLKPPRLWYHNVPLRNMIIYYYGGRLSSDLLKLYEASRKAYNESALKLWKTDDEISSLIDEGGESINKLIKEVDAESLFSPVLKITDDFKNSLSEELKKSIEMIESEFAESYRKAGTIELPARKLSSSKAEDLISDRNSAYNKLYRGWENSAFVLFEDWRLDKEIYQIRSSLSRNFLVTSLQIENSLKVKILPRIEKIHEELNKANLQIVEGKDPVIDIISNARVLLHDTLIERLVPDTIEAFFESNLAELIDKLEYQLRTQIDFVNDKRALIKKEDYIREIRAGEIDYFSPKELISFEQLSTFGKVVNNLKTTIVSKGEELQNDILNLDQISDFALESAMAILREEADTDDKARSIAGNGLKRAIQKTEDIKQLVNDLNQELSGHLSDVVAKLSNELNELKVNENVFNIKLRITKAKTIARTKKIKEDIFNFIRNFIPIVKNTFKNTWKKTSKIYSKFRKRFGLETKVVSISSEISDFLAETSDAIEKLPYVYQRLFQIRPVEDDRFFEGRNVELERMRVAYTNWKSGRYAPVAIVGEKGSGSTSMVRHFLKNFAEGEEVIYTASPEVIYREQDYLRFFEKVFEQTRFSSAADIISFAEKLPVKKIIVVENLQHFFLRKVDGFNCLRLLFELISKSNKKIFWIISSTLYSWNYLKKTVGVADYFGYEILLQSFTDNEIVEVIMKRHRVSGFRIAFEASEEDLESKTFQKLNDSEKQNYLKKEYFSKLNKFARSNLSISLLYWLRSTRDVSDNTITIGSVLNFDFSFLQSFSSEKIFILHALLLHDGLTEKELTEMFNYTPESINLVLMMLLDDGVINKNGALYQINLLLYRPTVTLLQSRNIIH